MIAVFAVMAGLLVTLGVVIASGEATEIVQPLGFSSAFGLVAVAAFAVPGAGPWLGVLAPITLVVVVVTVYLRDSSGGTPGRPSLIRSRSATNDNS